MGEQELRKDKGPTTSKQLFRVNFDELIRCDHRTASLVQGVESPLVATLRSEYLECVTYAMLGLEVLRRGRATQRELQVVCGGFVYAAMWCTSWKWECCPSPLPLWK